MTPRGVLLECFRAALDAVDARRCVRASLQRPSLPAGDWQVVAIGKAAGAMAQGAIDAIGARVAGGRVVVPPDHLPPGWTGERHGLDVLIASHPVPDERSLAAGEAVAQYVATQPERARLLFLISGGASSLVEWLQPGLTLADLQAFGHWALTSGAPIERVNALRRRLSRLKGGGLAGLIGQRRVLSLMISDVPGDDPRLIGSGLLHASETDAASDDVAGLPTSIADIVRRAQADGRERSVAVPRVPVRMVATLHQARLAAAATARTRGIAARVSTRRIAGEAEPLGRELARRLRRFPANMLHVWGGESTVSLPAHAGRGGRNQHLALSAALGFEEHRTSRAVLLAAGTDGIDGVTTDAGALVDAGTCMRGRDGGFDPQMSLASADSGSFLEASGDLLHTGATLTNVGDLVLALKDGQGER
jgi:glycerate 2-kinase